MYTITFYSFKGGVGRTMALVNVGAELAKMGRKVLLVDFDLEAPGLETFDLLRSPKPHPGIVEYVTDYKRTMHAPDVREYIYQAAPIGTGNGKLWVMPAGRRDMNYQKGLVKINWQELYRDRDGFLLFEDTKAQWEQEFKPDYVLIDSRTGHTDVEGICTRQLPDAVVTLFFPNEQNLVGLKDVCRWIRHERDSGLKKDVRLHFVMSNVPDLDDEDEILRRRVERFHQDLNIERLAAVIHRYESSLLFNQAVFVLDKPRSRLTREYQTLVKDLIVYNPKDRDGALQFLKRYVQNYLPNAARILATEDSMFEVPFDPLGLQLKPEAVKQTIHNIIANHLDDPDILIAVAEAKQLAGENEESLKLLNRADGIQPGLAQVLFDRALCKKSLRDTKGAAEDLVHYVQTPNLESSQVIRAFEELRTVAPNNFVEAVRQIDITTFDLQTQWEIATLLAETDNGLEPAIDIMKRCLSKQQTVWDLSFYDGPEYELSNFLIRARRWNETIEVLATDNSHSQTLVATVNRAMASWGATGDLPEELCRFVLDSQATGGPYEGHLEVPLDARAMILWRLEKQAEALSVLDQAAEQAERFPERPFSHWRYRTVSHDAFLEDCKQLRRMIQGESIRPAFLGDAPIMPR